jgi:hypothetical protein
MAKTTPKRTPIKKTTKTKSAPVKVSKYATAKAARNAARPKKTPKRITVRSLRSWNLWLGLLLVAEAVVIGVIGKSSSMAITSNFLNVDTLASRSAGHAVYAQASSHSFDINLVLVVAVFLCISAIFHLLIATYCRSSYEKQLQIQTNQLRWIDYGLSAGVMLMAIALINGISDVASLMMIFVLVVLLHVFGYFLEVRPDVAARTKKYIFWGLLVAGGTVWLAIASYTKSAIVNGVGLPHFIYWIDGTIFAMTALLALNTYFNYQKKGKWADYLYGERAYMVLSFVAKTALAWQLFAGLLK